MDRNNRGNNKNNSKNSRDNHNNRNYRDYRNQRDYRNNPAEREYRDYRREATRDNIVRIDGKSNNSKRRSKNGKIPLGARLKPEYIGISIFILILIYVIINVYMYYTKDKLSIYEVQAADIYTDNNISGIAVRDERLVTCEASGYINYYIRNGKRTAKSSLIYTIDEGMQRHNLINGKEGALALNKKEINEIKRTISEFKNDNKTNGIYNISDFQYELDNIINSLISENMITYMEEVSNQDIGNSAFRKVYSDQSGVISYKTDNLYGIKPEEINESHFNSDFEYKAENIRASGLISEGEPVYRICSNENWSIVSMIEEKLYLDMLEKTDVNIRINNDPTVIPAKMDVWQHGSNYFATISLNRYMLKYIDERFLKIEISTTDETGYKIPKSAISKKEFFLIPSEYLFRKENQSKRFVMKEAYDAGTGSVVYEEKPVTVYYNDGSYCYLDMNGFSEGDQLINNETGEHYRIGLTNYLEGVYNVNKGYYVFRRIERIKENNDYCIVKSGTENGIALYDHIALDAEKAVESSLIY